MATINPALPASNHIAGDANHPQDHDTIVLALALIVSTLNLKVEKVNNKAGTVITLVAADVSADPAGYADAAISNLIVADDPLGDRSWAGGNFRPILEYNTSTASWPTRLSSTADQTKRFEWVGPNASPPPVGSGYAVEGDLLSGLI